jgi:hypothetical protein
MSSRALPTSEAKSLKEEVVRGGVRDVLVAVGELDQTTREPDHASITNVPAICMKLPPLSPRWRVSGESSASIHGRAVLGLRTCTDLALSQPVRAIGLPLQIEQESERQPLGLYEGERVVMVPVPDEHHAGAGLAEHRLVRRSVTTCAWQNGQPK